MLIKTTLNEYTSIVKKNGRLHIDISNAQNLKLCFSLKWFCAIIILINYTTYSLIENVNIDYKYLVQSLYVGGIDT